MGRMNPVWPWFRLTPYLGVTTFLGLTDTPNSYAGAAGQVVRVDAGGNALEFASFVWNITPTGTIDGSNATFTLPSSPNPATSLRVYLNGQRFILNGDYTLSGATLSMVVAPDVGSTLLVDYVV